MRSPAAYVMYYGRCKRCLLHMSCMSGDAGAACCICDSVLLAAYVMYVGGGRRCLRLLALHWGTPHPEPAYVDAPIMCIYTCTNNLGLHAHRPASTMCLACWRAAVPTYINSPRVCRHPGTHIHSTRLRACLLSCGSTQLRACVSCPVDQRIVCSVRTAQGEAG